MKRKWTFPALTILFVGSLPLAPAQNPVAPPGPVPGTRMTDAYVRDVARFAYLWAWPMVNMHNRREALEKAPEPGLSNGVSPVAPPNHLCMLCDYIHHDQKMVACPNQDVVYGFAILELNREPVVVQVPDFGKRFWVYQLGDQRTDGFGSLGKMYGTKPGCYLLVGQNWKGPTPDGIEAVFRCPTRVGYLIPRIFMDDTAEDRKAILPVVSQITAYPLSQFTGKMQARDWTKLPTFKRARPATPGEFKWVDPQRFFDVLGDVLDEVPPFAGEESTYRLVRSILDAAKKDPKIKATLQQAAVEADKEVIDPLFQFRNICVPAHNGWSTPKNGASFGTDYLTRTAIARSNIFVNKPEETSYFYQDLDAQGNRLNGSKRYTVTFAKGQLPPVKGFWSLTLYDQHHCFHPNEQNRYSLGTKNKNLTYNDDGSLTFYVQGQAPDKDKVSNWLPAPKGDFSLYIRAYWPQPAIAEGKWAPPPVVVAK